MKKIVIMIWLLIIPAISYAPAEPVRELEDQSHSKPGTSSHQATEQNLSKIEAEQASAKQGPSSHTNDNSSLKITTTKDNQSINLNGDPIATITHPEQKNWLSSSTGSSKIIDHGDGNFSITTDTTQKGWFRTKKSSITTKIENSNLSPDQILNKVQEVSKNNSVQDIHTQLQNKITNKKNDIKSDPEKTKTAYNSLKKNGITYETIQFDDGSREMNIHNINGTYRSIKVNIDGSIISDNMYDTDGQAINYSKLQPDPDTATTLVNGQTYQTSPLPEKGGPEVAYYSKENKLIQKFYTKTGEKENFTYQKDGTIIGTKKDDQGNVTQITTYDAQGQPQQSKIPGVTDTGTTTVHIMNYDKQGMPSSLISYY